MNDEIELIGASQLRKITANYSTMDMLDLTVRFAENNYEKKLWSLLSRVYQDKKWFDDKAEADQQSYCDRSRLSNYVSRMMASNVPGEYKMQFFTSFRIDKVYKPDDAVALDLIRNCNKKRLNIAGFFISGYEYEKAAYKEILANKDIFKIVIKNIGIERLVLLYEHIIDTETKEVITGAIRTLNEYKPKLYYRNEDNIKRVTDKVFASKEVFYTSKMLFCITFNVPANCLPEKSDLYKILKITVNYEERISKDFVKKYDLNFDYSDEAMCRYYIANKKSVNEKLLVSKFANHIVRIENQEIKAKLLRNAFKRGGYFRMYAGCMQDGKVIVQKQKKFHYSDEDIEWCSSLAGLKPDKTN